MYKIRIILDTEEDVIRTILVDENITLETLHTTIAEAFGFEGFEMASFYRTDEEWNQGEEIPLISMAEAGEETTMANSYLREIMPFEQSKLIYVYDFLNLWTFYVDVVEITTEQSDDLPKTILEVGEVPKKAPEKEFVAENYGDDEEDEFKDDFDYLDDFDFDKY